MIMLSRNGALDDPIGGTGRGRGKAPDDHATEGVELGITASVSDCSGASRMAGLRSGPSSLFLKTNVLPMTLVTSILARGIAMSMLQYRHEDTGSPS
jgi:hypothetical protein